MFFLFSRPILSAHAEVRKTEITLTQSKLNVSLLQNKTNHLQAIFVYNVSKATTHGRLILTEKTTTTKKERNSTG